jgi:hypothetical protein
VSVCASTGVQGGDSQPALALGSPGAAAAEEDDGQGGMVNRHQLDEGQMTGAVRTVLWPERHWVLARGPGQQPCRQSMLALQTLPAGNSNVFQFLG